MVRLRLCAVRISLIVTLAVALFALPALAFDYDRYQETDLDALLAKKRPASGVDLFSVLPMKLNVTLAAYGEPCQSGMAIKSLTMAGVFNPDVKITRCIQVRSAKGQQVKLFIQDEVSNFLPKEVPLGGALTLFAVHLYTGKDGPGLLVNEFRTETTAGATEPPCGCGSPDFHPGIDVTNDAERAPVQAVDDGVVVRVEADESAAVEIPNIGRCGRYVVIKHGYLGGRAVYTRYAQLGRIVGMDGQPLVVGGKVKKADKIGETGSRKILHFEIRPVDAATMDTSAGWTSRVGSDPSMEWSRYQPVDPRTFDFSKFAKAGK
jgi:murein DD-endopeptidase MepM/ murein hydrolase activator NlpD